MIVAFNKPTIKIRYTVWNSLTSTSLKYINEHIIIQYCSSIIGLYVNKNKSARSVYRMQHMSHVVDMQSDYVWIM